MKWRSLGLSVILISSILLHEGLARLVGAGRQLSHLQHTQPRHDAESHFAAGLPFPLACADIIDVELIPGVSDRLATELLASRTGVATAAARLPSAEALQLVRGVGPSLGHALSRYLSMEPQCPPSYLGATGAP